MSNETRGHAIRDRLRRIGISDREFSARTKIDRKTIVRAIEGHSSETTYRAIEAALADLEHELGMDDMTPEPDLVEFRVTGNFGVDVVVKGPIADMAQLQQAVSELIKELRSPSDGQT